MWFWYPRRELSASVLELWGHWLERVAAAAAVHTDISAASMHARRE
jgi:hypothetical protein